MHPERRPNVGRSPESLEARLRALVQPPVPADLEARLLATVPARLPAPRRRWLVWAGALAAACLLAVLAWLGRDGKGPALHPEAPERANQATPRSPAGPDGPAWWAARRDLDEAETPPFAWPLEETPPVTVATALSPDLLN
jgi:hypothetical protein